MLSLIPEKEDRVCMNMSRHILLVRKYLSNTINIERKENTIKHAFHI
jgi:hypothetical protein